MLKPETTPAQVGRRLCLLALLALSCSSPSEPVDSSLPADVASYLYTNAVNKRYFEVSPSPDTCGGCKDTLVDSVWRVFTEDSVYWSQSYRAIRHFRYDSVAGVWIALGDEHASSRREGLLRDSLVLDPSLRYKLLIAPVRTGTTWHVDDSNAILATIIAEEILPLEIDSTRTWHVQRGAVGDEWWAPGLGRVQYEELEAGGGRKLGRLIAVGTLH
jgi:hypothetical protein